MRCGLLKSVTSLNWCLCMHIAELELKKKIAKEKIAKEGEGRQTKLGYKNNELRGY